MTIAPSLLLLVVILWPLFLAFLCLLPKLGPMMVNWGTKATHSQQGGFAMVTILLAIGFVGLLFVRGRGRRI